MASLAEFNAYHDELTDHGIGKDVKDAYNSLRDHAAKSAWNVVSTVAASGFGKGVAITLALIVGGGALLFGGLAANDAITATNLAGTFSSNVGVADGIVGGAQVAIEKFLFTTPGLLALGIGGTLGAVSTVHSYNRDVQADMAKALARVRHHEIEQERAKVQGASAALPRAPQVTEEREPRIIEERKQPGSDDPVGTKWRAAEEARKVARTYSPATGVFHG